MNSELFHSVRWLTDEIAKGLAGRHGASPGVGEVLARLAAQDVSTAAFREIEPRRIEACGLLPETTAAAMLVAPGLAAAIAAVEEHLHWVQNANYSDAILGPGYMAGYGYCEIIGPRGFFAGDDFLLGLLLLGPHRHYLDHYHPAPELYWLLSGPTAWSHGRGPFQSADADTTFAHAPMQLHATRTGDTPLLAVWCWTSDTGTPAEFA